MDRGEKKRKDFPSVVEPANRCMNGRSVCGSRPASVVSSTLPLHQTPALCFSSTSRHSYTSHSFDADAGIVFASVFVSAFPRGGLCGLLVLMFSEKGTPLKGFPQCILSAAWGQMKRDEETRMLLVAYFFFFFALVPLSYAYVDY